MKIRYRYIVWNNVRKFQENRIRIVFELRALVWGLGWRFQGCGI